MDSVVSNSSEALPTLVERWLARFEHSLFSGQANELSELFCEDSHWRDLLAFTWNITPHEGRQAIAEALHARQPEVQATQFRLALGRTPPRCVERHGQQSIEAIFSFDTAIARGSGVVRLDAENPGKACVLSTALDEIKGCEEPIGSRRPSHSRVFGEGNWTDRRREQSSFADRDPEVLVVGAGQAGLAVAARLGFLGVDTLVVDRTARVGDVWRNRYHSLALHNEARLNQFPYLPFPCSWPNYLPKDLVANWLETYAWAMECNVWTETEFLGAEFAADGVADWKARVRCFDGVLRVLRPQHIVFANGVAGRPIIPQFNGASDFSGVLMHAHDFTSGAEWAGKNAIVFGTGTSGHDIAQDLFSHGANTTLVQRGSTTVASVRASGLINTLYNHENIPVEDADLISSSNTYPLLVRGFQLAVEQMKEIDADLISALEKRGFRLDYGDDETGHQMKFLRRHGGFYLNCGCSDLIADGRIKLLHSENIDKLNASGVQMLDGTIQSANLIVTATGYQSQREVVRELMGDSIADAIGDVWGIADDGELANMYRPTPQQGLWFAGGGFVHARIYSRFIALGIKARQLGLRTQTDYIRKYRQ